MEFETYYAASYDRVRRAMTLSFRDPELAEEITQEAFLQTLRKWKTVSLLDHPEGWTMVVALNKGRDIYRRRVRHRAKQSVFVQPAVMASGEGNVDDRLTVTELLEGLSDRQREALLLRYISQLTIPEIARVMGCAVNADRKQQH